MCRFYKRLHTSIHMTIHAYCLFGSVQLFVPHISNTKEKPKILAAYCLQFHAIPHATTAAENCWLSCKFACANCGSTWVLALLAAALIGKRIRLLLNFCLSLTSIDIERLRTFAYLCWNYSNKSLQDILSCLMNATKSVIVVVQWAVHDKS